MTKPPSAAAETPADPNAHISSNEIRRDIGDTQMEIGRLYGEIDKRQSFIIKLRAILATRGEHQL